MVKFKYISTDIEYEPWELEPFPIVSNPLPYANLPEGEYLIRGTQRGHRKKYYHYHNTWYLVANVTSDNGQYFCDATEYMLFPALSEKEWQKIMAVDRKILTKLWQRYLFGYLHWIELRKLRRDIRKDFLKFP